MPRGRLLCSPHLSARKPLRALGSAVFPGPRFAACGVQAQRAPEEWVNLRFQTVLGGTPVPSGGHPAETAGPSRSPLFTLSLLPWRLHHAFLFGRGPPAPAPVSCPRVCVLVFPSPPSPPPSPALPASFGASGLCFRQELAAASRWPEPGVGSSPAGEGMLRGTPDRSVWGPAGCRHAAWLPVTLPLPVGPDVLAGGTDAGVEVGWPGPTGVSGGALGAVAAVQGGRAGSVAGWAWAAGWSG